MERPGVLMENGHVTHFTFAVLDVPKDDERGNDTHGSKVIVVPFDGAALDRDLHDNTRTFKADKRYLVFPCSRGLGGQNKVFINVDGKTYMSVYDALIASSNPDRIGIIGFSAGGHLASTAGTHFDAGDPKSEDPIARQSCRPTERSP
jgi:hypothetical protein